MAASPLAEPLFALREANTTILENADFVLRELPTLSLDAELQGAVEAVWHGLQDTAGSAVPCTLLRLEDYGTAAPLLPPIRTRSWNGSKIGWSCRSLVWTAR